MKATLTFYKIIATIVGVLIIVIVFIGLPVILTTSSGSGWHQAAEDLGVAHGWLFIICLITTFVPCRYTKWSISFTLLTLIFGTIPILTFWTEVRVVRAIEPLLAAAE